MKCNSGFKPERVLWSLDDGGPFHKHVKNSFRESYLAAVRQFSDLPFISCYATNGAVRRATFQEFDTDVRIAIARLAQDSERNDVIMIVTRNSYEGLAYFVAAVLLGHTVCPMNPDEGIERIRQKTALIGRPISAWVDQRLNSLMSALGAQSLSLDDRSEPKETPAFREIPPTQAMVLIFTSGSTGYSKIVEQTEIGLLSNADALIEWHGLGPGHSLATPLPTFHVNALEFSFICTLLSGARLVLWENFIPPVILETLQREKCTILSIVPPLLRLLMQKMVQAERYDLSDLRYIVTAAAPLSVELVRQALERFKVPIIQGYGLSEAINFTCVMPIDLPHPDYLKWATAFEWPSIGPALPGNQVYILNEDLEALGEGEIGELCVRGPVVMLQYMHDEEKSVFAGSYLHTGDLALFRRDAEGRPFYFIAGRKKETIKRYGMTISLREVDDLVAGFEFEEFDAISVPFENEWSGEDVGLVVKKDSGWDAAVQDRFARRLENVLPAHLRPKLVILTHQPLRTPSGKPLRWTFTPLFARFNKSIPAQKVTFMSDGDAT